MTDIGELVKQLRDEDYYKADYHDAAADALEAQAKRIAELEELKEYLSGSLLRESNRTLKAIQIWGDIEEIANPLRSRIAVLEALLDDMIELAEAGNLMDDPAYEAARAAREGEKG